MTTWTPKTKQDETWTSSGETGLGVFSRQVFSHASSNGLHVFAFGNPAVGVEGWYNKSVENESWEAA